jgi:predicted transposase YbfD/YdcC
MPSKTNEKSGRRLLIENFRISSLDASDPQRLERVLRAHWAIENNLYWVLDVAFDEDSKRTQ